MKRLLTLHPQEYALSISATTRAPRPGEEEGREYFFKTKEAFEEMIARRPERVIEIAVKGMLPKGPLGRAMFRKLKVYAGNEHNHAAQQPQVLDI